MLGQFLLLMLLATQEAIFEIHFARELYSLIMNYIFGDSFPPYVMAWPMRIKPPIVKARRHELWGDGD